VLRVKARQFPQVPVKTGSRRPRAQAPGLVDTMAVRRAGPRSPARSRSAAGARRGRPHCIEREYCRSRAICWPRLFPVYSHFCTVMSAMQEALPLSRRGYDRKGADVRHNAKCYPFGRRCSWSAPAGGVTPGVVPFGRRMACPLLLAGVPVPPGARPAAANGCAGPTGLPRRCWPCAILGACVPSGCSLFSHAGRSSVGVAAPRERGAFSFQGRPYGARLIVTRMQPDLTG